MTRRRLLEVEYSRGEEEVVVHLRSPNLGQVPRDTLRHWRNANREFLLAIRSLLDGAIERAAPPEPGEGQRRSRRRQRVEVTEEEKA